MKIFNITRTALFSLLLLGNHCTSLAQFTLIGSNAGTLWQLNTLETAGPKLITEASSQMTIYNLDLSVYQVLNIPALSPPFMQEGVGYITESLFDTDPSTIEFVQSYRDTTECFGCFKYGLRILRADGTVLYNKFQAYLYNRLSLGVRSEPIFNTTTGTYMVLDTASYSHSQIFLLPGHLPCDQCSGAALSNGGEHVALSGTNITAFPNPTSDDATIRYDLPSGITQGSLVFFNAQGAEVKRMPVNGSGTMRITTADLPAATYLYQIETSQGVIGAKRLVVVR